MTLSGKQAFSLTFKPALRNLMGRFANLDAATMHLRRLEVKVMMRRAVELMKDEAPKDTGEFASQIRGQTFSNSPNNLGFNITSPQPLGNWITGGTRPHVIAPKRASKLAFYWAGGPQGAGTYFFGKVNHPGTKPNKYVGRAYRRWLPGARSGLAKIANGYVRVMQGSK